MDKKRSGMDSWMYNNPEMFNMGLGLLKGLEEDKRNKALSESEVAKTQYGYLTGAGTGNVNNLNVNNTGNRVMQGAMTGMTMKRDSDFQNKLFDAIAQKKGSATDNKPNTLKGINNDPVMTNTNHLDVFNRSQEAKRDADDLYANLSNNAESMPLRPESNAPYQPSSMFTDMSQQDMVSKSMTYADKKKVMDDYLRDMKQKNLMRPSGTMLGGY